MHATDSIYASVSYFGVGVFCRDDVKIGDVVMEMPLNYTISSFHDYFPHMNEVLEVVKHLGTDPESKSEIHMLRLVLNLNYLKYFNSDRFFRIWFDNLPEYPDYMPYWDDLDKKILEKFLFMPTIKDDLYITGFKVFDEALKLAKERVNKIDPNYLNLMLTRKKVENAINIVKTRSFPITRKGFKILSEKYSSIKPEDIEEVGKIILPGMDAVNYESRISEHPDLEQGNLLFQNGKAILKAPRDFNRGEEFLMNYNSRYSVIEILKNYGFIPIDTMLRTTVFKNEYFDLSSAPNAFKKVCLAIRACFEPDSTFNYFNVPKLTNALDVAKINFLRLKFYMEKEINETTMMDVFNQLAKGTQDTKSEVAAIASFLNDYYGGFLYAKSFRKDIDSLLDLYHRNEDPEVSIQMLLEGNELNINADDSKVNLDRKERFREILKFCFLNHHNATVNMRGATELMDQAADKLLKELTEEMIYELS